MEATSTLSQVFTSTLLGYGKFLFFFFVLLIIPLKLFLGDFFKKI